MEIARICCVFCQYNVLKHVSSYSTELERGRRTLIKMSVKVSDGSGSTTKQVIRPHTSLPYQKMNHHHPTKSNTMDLAIVTLPRKVGGGLTTQETKRSCNVRADVERSLARLPLPPKWAPISPDWRLRTVGAGTLRGLLP